MNALLPFFSRPTLLCVALCITLYPGTAQGQTDQGQTTTLTPSEEPEANIEALLGAMQARYGATGYRTLTFVQETTIHTPQGPRVQTWYEAISLPGRLRVDIAPLADGNTFLVVGDSTHVARGGRAVTHRPDGNPLVFLGFDLPYLSTAQALAGMQRLGIDTGALREDSWQGRPALVVGGGPGDERSPQVWFDRERLVFVRFVKPGEQGVEDYRFDDYVPLGGGWVSPHVEVYVGGELAVEERYRAIQADVALPDGTFDPRAWTTVSWWTAADYDGSE